MPYYCKNMLRTGTGAYSWAVFRQGRGEPVASGIEEDTAIYLRDMYNGVEGKPTPKPTAHLRPCISRAEEEEWKRDPDDADTK